jgi:transposase-like protein
MGRRSKYSAEFKQDAVSRMGQGGKTITALAEQLGVRRKFLYLWREQLQAGGKTAFERGPGRPPRFSAQTWTGTLEKQDKGGTGRYLCNSNRDKQVNVPSRLTPKVV